MISSFCFPNRILFKFSLLISASLILWGCEVPKDYRISAEFTGPVKVSFTGNGTPVEKTVSDQVEIKLQNYFKEEPNSMAGDVRERTYFYFKIPDDTHLQIFPSVSADYVKNKMNYSETDAKNAANDFITHSTYKLTLGDQTYDIPSDTAVVFEGPFSKTIVTPNTGEPTESNLDELKALEANSGNQLVVKEPGYPIVGQIKNINYTPPKDQVGGGGVTPVATAENKGGGGGGCPMMQLTGDSNPSSTAWIWCVAIGVTAWIAGRRVRIRSR